MSIIYLQYSASKKKFYIHDLLDVLNSPTKFNLIRRQNFHFKLFESAMCTEDVPLLELMYPVYLLTTRLSYRRRFRSLLSCPLFVERY